MHPAFCNEEYFFRKKEFDIFGGVFQVFDPSDQMMLYAKQKSLVSRKNFRIYSDETQSEELLNIKQPRLMDYFLAYEVADVNSKNSVGVLKRQRCWSTLMKDEWIFQSESGHDVGVLKKKSILNALISECITLVPQTFIVEAEGNVVATLKESYNFTERKLRLSILDTDSVIDTRLLIALGILMIAKTQ